MELIQKVIFKGLVLFLACSGFMAQAALVSEKVTSTKKFTHNGIPMEAISGVFYFEFDPTLSKNQSIVDIKLAPKTAKGMVKANANFYIIQPQDPEQRQGGLIEISHNGSKSALTYFNYAKANLTPQSSADLGDGFIQQLGLSMIWIGWQPDVPNKDNLMRANLPRIQNKRGWVRSDWTISEAKNTLRLAHRDSIDTAYPVDRSRLDEAWLTRRLGRNELRTVVPAPLWKFNGAGDAIEGNFPQGIYELVYPARDPFVVGLGLAIVRDTAEYVKSDSSKYLVPKTMAFGEAQTGRFLRHFLNQGFNETELGQIAFDGMFIHSAGAGRGSFNHRFAQPSRDGHRFSTFFSPTDLFPFTTTRVRSNITNKKRGLLKRNHDDFYPKMFSVNTGYEYWGRAAALIHTHEVHDIAPIKSERIYHLASTQHYVESSSHMTLVDRKNKVYQGNPLDFKVHLRALLSHLREWVIANKEPPANAYPRFADQSLINFAHFELPSWLNLEKPYKPHTVYHMNFGPRWVEEGIIDKQPPQVQVETVPPVPNVDLNGHELGGIRHPLIEKPLATFLPWMLRYGKFAENEMVDFRGGVKRWDKQTIITRYSNKGKYLRQVDKEIAKNIEKGWLLPVDKARVKQQASWLWDWSMN
ncbi:alpha/beta hydrolase domain-containing protein [Thalassotalea aquiviva]|uniref:alpha/beta hydrolase domain-containing protein n=1 Tax=Thalassotalea aquiviva TaxID=3242415 RepID=UPI00352A1B74